MFDMSVGLPMASCALDPDEEGHRQRIIAAKDALGNQLLILVANNHYLH